MRRILGFLAAVLIKGLVVGISAFDADLEGVTVPAAAAAETALRTELEGLRDKILSLESTVSEKIREINRKDDAIAQKDKIIQQKSTSLDILRGEIETLQKKGAVDAQELVGKANARARELENQVMKLTAELEMETKKRDASDARASEAEKKVQELELEVRKLHKAKEEHNHRLKKTERALQVAEEELMRVQLDATSKSKELTKVHGAWLPPWLATHLSHIWEYTSAHWRKHGKPTFDVLLGKASESTVRAQKWFDPHVETARTKWIPAAEEKWRTFRTSVEPYVQTLSTKTVEYYEVSKNTVKPHIIKVVEVVNLYVEEARKFSKPHIDQIAIITKPHVEKVRVALNPHTKRVLHTYRKTLESATIYHHQVDLTSPLTSLLEVSWTRPHDTFKVMLQVTVEEFLKNHELTKVFATKELIWFMASAILALPVLLLYWILSSTFSKKIRRPTKTTNTSRTRRPKRRQAEK